MKPSAVIALIGANVLVFVWQRAASPLLEYYLALWPWQPVDGEVHFHVWQLLTYSFLHDTSHLGHLGFNMLGLWMFGAPIERQVGAGRFLSIYFASVVTAALTQLLVPPLFGTPLGGPTLGASGGVFGLLLAFAMMFPKLRVVPLIPPIPMPAWLFATLYTAVELYAGVTGSLSGIAHFAHLGGMIGAFLVLMQGRFARSRA